MKLIYSSTNSETPTDKMVDNTAPSLAAAPEPAATLPCDAACDDYPDPQPDELSKEEVLAKIREAGIAPTLVLSEALKRYPILGELQMTLYLEFAGEPVMAELSDGAPQAWLPEPLRSWPVWYLQLPHSWAADIPSLAAAPCLDTYIDQSPEPWYIAQWVALRSGLPAFADEYLGRHLRFPDFAIAGTADRASGSTAVLVLIECDDTLYVTGYPLGESFAAGLQAGGVSSSREPTFGRTVAALQAQVRDIEAGVRQPIHPDRLTLPVVHFPARKAATTPGQRQEQIIDAFFAKTPAVSSDRAEDGAVGLLHTIADYVPPELEADRQLWLKLTVSREMFVSMQAQPPLVQVRRLEPTATDAAMIAVTVRSGPHLLVAYAPAQDTRLALALDAFAAAGRCPLALENRRNGRLYVTSLAWPADCHGARGGAEPSEEGKFLGSYPREFHEEAMHLSERINARVMLYQGVIVDAATWQQRELSARGHAEGPCAGVRRIP